MHKAAKTQATLAISAPVSSFYVFIDQDTEGELYVSLTNDGVIMDLLLHGEMIGTWARTAQEIVDSFDWS